MLSTVKVPEPFEPIFEKAEATVSAFFDQMKRDPSRGVIEIAGDRYLFLRGGSLLSILHDRMTEQFGFEVANFFMYDFAKTIGRSDAERFAEKMNLQDPVEKLSAGPVHFSHSGLAFVDILSESAPSPDENYFLVYDHPNTFESEKFLKSGKQSENPVCFFSAGYSSGWCSFSFGLELDAKEISCTARGDAHCRFIMAPEDRLEERVEAYLNS